MSAPMSTAASAALKTTTRLRDAAVVVATLAAATVAVFAELWFSVGLVVVAGASWVVVRETPVARGTPVVRRTGIAARRRVLDAGRIVQVAFLLLGASLVWRLDFRLLPLAVLGVWALVCAADLDRLSQRFPHASPPTCQRKLVRGHLRRLAVVAVVSTVAVGAASLIRLEVRLATVMLLALFVVVVMLRVGRESTQIREEPRDEGE